jgi:hypothetical protein
VGNFASGSSSPAIILLKLANGKSDKCTIEVITLVLGNDSDLIFSAIADLPEPLFPRTRYWYPLGQEIPFESIWDFESSQVLPLPDQN